MSASADISKLLSGFGEARKRMEAAALKATDRAGDMVLGNAQQLCPVDTGTLQASGTTEPAQIVGNQVSKVIGFNTVYATAVHENMTARHKVGQHHYLETALRESTTKVNEYIRNEMEKAL